MFVCVEVLRPSQPNGVMFTGQAKSSKRLTSSVHILSPETDNCPSWISGRERMTVENISWSISTKECCRPQGWGGLNPRPPGLQSDGASNWLQGYKLFFLFLLKNIGCGYSLEPPQWGHSYEYTQSMFWAEIWKISEFLSENFQFLVVKFSIYLNRPVFVMTIFTWHFT